MLHSSLLYEVSRLAQNEDERIFEEHSRNCQPLFLTAGQLDAAFPDDCIQPALGT